MSVNDGLRTSRRRPGSPPSAPARAPARCRRGSGPTTACGLTALPTSCAVAISTTRTRPSSTSTSTVARCAANAYCTCASPWPVDRVQRRGRPVPPLHGLLDRRRRRARRPGRPRTAPSAVDAPCRRRATSPRRRAGRASSRARTAWQAARTAPPVMYVCRDADVDPALPTAVSAVATVTRSHAQLGAGDLRLHGDQPLARPRRRRCAPARPARRRSPPAAPGRWRSRRSPRRSRRS